MKALILILFLFCVGCSKGSWENDQELRREIFKECLSLIPDGPKVTKYNDWHEVVSECGSEAFHQSRIYVLN